MRVSNRTGGAGVPPVRRARYGDLGRRSKMIATATGLVGSGPYLKRKIVQALPFVICGRRSSRSRQASRSADRARREQQSRLIGLSTDRRLRGRSRCRGFVILRTRLDRCENDQSRCAAPRLLFVRPSGSRPISLASLSKVQTPKASHRPQGARRIPGAMPCQWTTRVAHGSLPTPQEKGGVVCTSSVGVRVSPRETPEPR